MAILQILKNPKSSTAEAYRTLRTNLQFSQGDKKIKTVVITSTVSGEGKSTTCANMAVALAQGGYKVLVMDCDLRKPTIHKVFKLSNDKGLTNFLVGDINLTATIKQTEVEGLHVITSGVIPPNPSELLNCKRMEEYLEKFKEVYDYIIMDTPPVCLVTDAQILAGKTDGSILVASCKQAHKKSLVQAKVLLENVGANILGVVLNKAESKLLGYGKYYRKGYHDYASI